MRMSMQMILWTFDGLLSFYSFIVPELCYLQIVRNPLRQKPPPPKANSHCKDKKIKKKLRNILS